MYNFLRFSVVYYVYYMKSGYLVFMIVTKFVKSSFVYDRWSLKVLKSMMKHGVVLFYGTYFVGKALLASFNKWQSSQT